MYQVDFDDKGNKHYHFYIYKGDSETIYDTPKRNCTENLNLDLIDECWFRLGKIVKTNKTTTLKEVFKKQLEKDIDRNVMVLRITSDETKQLDATTYAYEIEYTLRGGEVKTTEQWKFTISEEIAE